MNARHPLPENPPKRSSGLTRDVYLLAAASLFADISTEMLYPVLPQFLVQNLGVSGSILGLIDGFARAVQNIVQGLSGTISDRLRRHKAVALAGYAVAACAKPFMGLSTTWEALLGARLLDRFGTGVRSAPRDALLAGSVEPAVRGRAFGLESLGDNAGAFIGPLVTAATLALTQTHLRTIFFIAAIPGLLALVFTSFVRGQSASGDDGAVDGTEPERLSRVYRRFLMISAVLEAGNCGSAFLILRTHDFGATLDQSILIYACFNLAAAIASYPAGSLSDRFGRRNLLAAGYGIFIACFLGLSAGVNLWTATLLFAGYGAHQGIFRAVGKAYASDLGTSRRKAASLGWYTATVGIAQLFASLVAGLLWDRLGHTSVFLFGASVALVGTAALLLMPRCQWPGQVTAGR